MALSLFIIDRHNLKYDLSRANILPKQKPVKFYQNGNFFSQARSGIGRIETRQYLSIAKQKPRQFPGRAFFALGVY